MDRLLFGYVGNVKKEVSIRAAFKAIAEGKQVAILVPTTILGQQHFETFRERFQDHAVNIELLSRFRRQTPQKDTMNGLARGLVDIVLGTQRILSKGIDYRAFALIV